MRQTSLSLALCAAFASPAFAETQPDFVGETIVVTPTRIEVEDTQAPFASEVHTRSMIEQSGASSLYDYLAQHSSLQVLPNYGNKAAPKISTRGYGMSDGYQNIVVSLDGRRLNNIDLGPQLLGSIPLGDIERIEITKGSGSVLFGDGATAGSVQIITRPHNGLSVQASAGNFGARNGTLAAGLVRDAYSLSASVDYANFEGTSSRDIAGYRDSALNRNQQGEIEIRPLEGLTVKLDGSRSRIDTRYVGNLTLAEYKSDPAQNGGNAYTHQKFESDVWGAGLAYEWAPGWTLSAQHHREDKVSDYVSYAFKADYDYRSSELAMAYRGKSLSVTVGAQSFDGVRIGGSNRTHKDNSGWFVQSQYRLGATTVSAGARTENVEYVYLPSTGSALRQDNDLVAWDLGVNHQLDARLSLFTNLNQAFQAPDIDRFFNYDGTFNTFIKPAKSRTLTAGVNHVTTINRLKLSVFRANVDDEIYFEPLTYTNTNFDQTHKYGVELQDTWKVMPMLAATLNYAYTRAIIDLQVSSGGALDGKALPGVPRHSVNLGLNWRVTPVSNINLTHTWRSSTWAAEDFDNNNAQRQQAYQSTNLAYQYHYKNMEWMASVENLFEQSNGIWIRDDVIYPVNFTRNWRVGMKINF